MEDHPNKLAIQYASPPKHGPRRTFSGWYVSFGAINIVVAGLCLLVDALAIVGMLSANQSVWTSWFDVFVLTGIGFASDGGIVVGSMVSFLRQPWSRRLLNWSLTGQIAVALLFILTSFITNQYDPSRTIRGYGGAIILFAALRGGYAFLFLIAYNNIRADFYFGTRDDPTPIEPIHTPPQPPTPTFKVRGIDSKTGKPTEFTSKAPTPELAAKSAISLGVSPSSIHIEKI